MKKKYIYITTIILLPIILFSVIGIDVSIYQCKHRGLLEFSFNGLNKFHDMKCNCTEQELALEDENSTDSIQAPQPTCSSCEESAIPVPQKSDCCSETKNEIVENKVEAKLINISNKGFENQISKDYSGTNAQFKYDKLPCCSTSNDYYSLSVDSLVIEKSVSIQLSKPQEPNSLSLFESIIPKYIKTNVSAKDIPDKLHIQKILAFIAVSSNSNEDPDYSA